MMIEDVEDWESGLLPTAAEVHGREPVATLELIHRPAKPKPLVVKRARAKTALPTPKQRTADQHRLAAAHMRDRKSAKRTVVSRLKTKKMIAGSLQKLRNAGRLRMEVARRWH